MLYVIGTPIGNLEDLSYRAARTLLEVPIVLAEDTRAFATLIERAAQLTGLPRNSNQQVWSYYKQVEFEKLPDIISHLQDGIDIALVSQAGMPVISDPGQLLIHTAKKRGLPYTVIPSATAVDTALVLSGIKHTHFLSLGFLPKKDAELTRLYARLYTIHETLGDTAFVAYESPERICSSLTLLHSLYPQIELYVARELTKKFEQLITVTDPAVDLEKVKGECVVVWRFISRTAYSLVSQRRGGPFRGF